MVVMSVDALPTRSMNWTRSIGRRQTSPSGCLEERLIWLPMSVDLSALEEAVEV
jgi:hypothetical protein